MFLIGTLIAVTAFYSIIGRLSSPEWDRIPVREWGLRDIAANALRGLDRCAVETIAMRHYTGGLEAHREPPAQQGRVS